LTGGQRRRLRLENLAHLLHMNQEMVGFAAAQYQVEHIAIEQIPGSAGLHARTDLRARQDEALGHQHLDGFAHRGAADAEGLTPFRFIGQQGSGRKFAVEDARADILRYTLRCRLIRAPLSAARLMPFSVSLI
jgi:hypothetical protein